MQDQIELPAEATAVCWIDRHEIAVAPRLLDHLVEIWDTDAHALVRTLVSTPPVPKTPGAYPAHAAVLRFDARHDELIVLDSYRGDIYAYDRTGKLLRHVTLDNPRLAELAPWFAEQDRTAKSQGKPFTPAFWNFPTLTIAADGSLWLADRLDGSKLNALHIARDGAVQHVALDTAGCPSLLFESLRAKATRCGSRGRWRASASRCCPPISATIHSPRVFVPPHSICASRAPVPLRRMRR